MDQFCNGNIDGNQVPRLHCFIHRKLVAHDFLPCSPTIEPKPNLVKEIRESLLRHLTAVVGNDGIAANFMLLHLLSKLGLALKNLLPFTQCISLTVDYLKSQHCFPCAKKGLRDQQVIENDLVEARQEDRTLGTQDFSRLLTMGRLMSMSFGETSLSLEHWQMVKELERLRRERLK
ncbi:hypothetical protein C1H46_032904 [Malus baccata]|uniref:Uncharacterized protein n=1 Tax=Malus baccata TaxID=106549 RepID=A0A540L5K2_MALBA|nr:hypothetical protein C1H46_032904 [Malus baccata]